jgi:hypothetical protein
LIDLRKIKSDAEYLNPYENLQIRWLYPEPPQKLSQSTYKATLDKVDFKLWVTEIIPNFDQLTKACHCQHEFQTENRCQGHLASGNLDNLISNPIILDRLKRGPMFRETSNGDLHLARTALKAALEELFDRHKKAGAHSWINKFMQRFDEEAQQLKTRDQNGEIDLQTLLFPAPGRITEHQKELDSFLKSTSSSQPINVVETTS